MSAVTSSRAAYNVVIGGVLIHLTLGTLYSWGCIQPYVTSYIRLHHPLVTSQDTTMIYACATLGHSITMPLVGVLHSTLGLRGSAALGVCLVGFATLASSLATSVTVLSILNGAFGVGIAFAYTCPMVSGYAWMPDRKGSVSGFIVAGFGAGAALFNEVAAQWVNPDNISPDPETGYYGEEVAGRVPGMYVVLGACYLFLGLLGSWMILPPPVDFVKGSLSDSSLVHHKAPPASNGRLSLGEYASVNSGGSLHETHRYDTTREGQAHHDGHGSPTSPRFVVKEVAEDQLERNCEMVAMSEAVHVSPEGDKVAIPRGSAMLLSACLDRDRASSDASLGAINGGACVQESTGSGIVQHHCRQERQLKVLDLLREVDFYHLSLSMMLTAVSGLFIAGNYKRIAQQRYPDSDQFLSAMGSFASLFNASGRVIGGMAVDKFGCFATLFVMTVCMTCLLLTYRATQTNWPSFFLFICLLHMIYGSNFAIYPTLTAELFGASTAGPNYGLVVMGFGLGSFVGMLCLSGVSGNNHVFLACAAFNFAGAVSVAFLWERRRRLKITS